MSFAVIFVPVITAYLIYFVLKLLNINFNLKK